MSALSDQLVEYEDFVELTKPFIAEAREDRETIKRLEAKIDRLYAIIFDLQSAAGSCVALMQFDVDEGRVPLTEVRRDVIAAARSRSDFQSTFAEVKTP